MDHVGKIVLVGITRVNAAGDAVAQLQYHGRITSITEDGIAIETPDVKHMTLPPAIESLQSAPPGEYRERSSGAVVVDPDLISTWELREPSEGGDLNWSYTRIKFPSTDAKGVPSADDPKKDGV
jgi:hypothetical protein